MRGGITALGFVLFVAGVIAYLFPSQIAHLAGLSASGFTVLTVSVHLTTASILLGFLGLVVLAIGLSSSAPETPARISTPSSSARAAPPPTRVDTAPIELRPDHYCLICGSPWTSLATDQCDACAFTVNFRMKRLGGKQLPAVSSISPTALRPMVELARAPANPDGSVHEGPQMDAITAVSTIGESAMQLLDSMATDLPTPMGAKYSVPGGLANPPCPSCGGPTHYTSYLTVTYTEKTGIYVPPPEVTMEGMTVVPGAPFSPHPEIHPGTPVPYSTTLSDKMHELYVCDQCGRVWRTAFSSGN